MEAIEEEIRQTNLAYKNETSESLKLELLKRGNLLYQERLFLRQQKGQKKIQPTKKESFGVGTFFLNLFLAGTDAEKNQFTKVFSIESDPNKKSEKWKTWKTFGNDLFSAFTIQFIQAVIVFLFSQSSATEYYTAAFVKWFERRLEKPQRKYEKPQTKDDNEEGYVNESEERKYGNNQLEIEDMDMKMDEISPTRRKSPNRRHAWIQKKKSESEFMTDIKSVS